MTIIKYNKILQLFAVFIFMMGKQLLRNTILTK